MKARWAWIGAALAAWLMGASISHAQAKAARPVDSSGPPPSPPTPVSQSPAIACRLELPDTVRVGAPVPLTLQLHNAERRPLRVLTWGTPFEGGWWQPFVQVTRGGVPIPYTGAMVKRGAPEPTDYLRMPAGATRHAALDLRDAFDLSVPGIYAVSSAIILHDVLIGGAHHRSEPSCTTVQVTIRP